MTCLMRGKQAGEGGGGVAPRGLLPLQPTFAKANFPKAAALTICNLEKGSRAQERLGVRQGSLSRPAIVKLQS